MTFCLLVRFFGFYLYIIIPFSKLCQKERIISPCGPAAIGR